MPEQNLNTWGFRLSGNGGQGLIKGAIILSQAALYAGYNVTQSQVYGPEARGGASMAEAKISRERILYPLVKTPDVLLCLSPQAYKKFHNDVKPDGWLILDSGIEDEALEEQESPVRLRRLPIVSSVREAFGNELSANVAALGAIIGLTGLLPQESLLEALADSFSGKILGINIEAFKLGMDLVK
ncbi:MAG: 2-oxoacid:acceptor oxidoreductase family protein [Clostridiales bacterium]|nr:2-oxoacid:acceptor oxidoreductase family protein [Clostridiales bacterium]